MRTFTIHALGPSGSGKTVFMSSLYTRLRLRRPDLAFYLKSDHDSSLYLNSVYNKVANPTEEWPEASQTVQEWNFTTCVSSPSGDFEPLRFCYLDYPGGVLTNPRAAQDEAIRSLVERLRGANALLVLLDGQAMLSLLQGERAGERYMDFDVTSSLEIAQQSRCPVHFAVTKWDLIEGRHTLAEVRNRLMLDENFQDLVNAKRQDTSASIRIFPVSAVGFGFAELLASGEMKKVGSRLRPFQVELPLLSVFPDFFQFAYDELRAREPDLAPKRPTVPDKLLDPGAARKWESVVRGVAKKAMPRLKEQLARRNPKLAPLLAVDTDSLVDDALGFAERLLLNRAERAERGRAEYAVQLMRLRQNVDSERSALQLLERQFEQFVSEYESSHPESVLAGGIERFSPAFKEREDTLGHLAEYDAGGLPGPSTGG